MIGIDYITNAGVRSGVGLRARRIYELIHERSGLDPVLYKLDGTKGRLRRHGDVLAQLRPWPGLLKAKTFNWLRLGKQLQAQRDTSRVLHLTNQTLSWLADGRSPTVVTVHDLIELLEPQSWAGGLAARYLYKGISRADQIVVVSRYTAQLVQEHFGVSQDRLTVIPNGVGDDFHPIADFRDTIGGQELLKDLKVSADQPVVLYVGSDHPRKNVVGAVQAFALVREKLPKAMFVKVGTPGLSEGRKVLLAEIDALDIRSHVKLVGQVPTERLNELYNLADVLLYPSRLEGFGLPPLQAMAAGLPVVTSNTTSLPEVVGDDDAFGERAALVLDPDDVDGLVDAVERILTDEALAADLRQRGLQRAQQFSWEAAADALEVVYKKL